MFNRNLPYLTQQFSALVHNTSPIITLICSVTTIGYLLSFSERAVRLTTVTPAYILPNSDFWIWTAFTFCFIELHWWEVLVDVVTVGLCGKMLEPLWGQMEMFKFFALSNFGVSILTTIYYLFYYMVTKNTDILFDTHIHGLAGYVAGISVAVRQIMPDNLIFKTRYGKLTNRNVPLTVLMMSIVMWAVNLLDGTYPAMFASGLLVSWIYLRFYQWHSNGRGDSSESFTFVSFFPSVVQPVISILVNPIYVCCLRLGVAKPPAPPRFVSTASSLQSIAISMPSVEPHDIERRKQIALKALSERFKSPDSSKHSQLPKSYPIVTVGSNHQHHQQQQHQSHHHNPHQHQHNKHQQHHQHHQHQHNGSHSHGQGGHSHGHGHSHHGGDAHNSLAVFMPPAASTGATLPITTARAEPRMISTMSPIAIPMPAPPPKENGSTRTVTLVDLEDAALTTTATDSLQQ